MDFCFYIFIYIYITEWIKLHSQLHNGDKINNKKNKNKFFIRLLYHYICL